MHRGRGQFEGPGNITDGKRGVGGLEDIQDAEGALHGLRCIVVVLHTAPPNGDSDDVSTPGGVSFLPPERAGNIGSAAFQAIPLFGMLFSISEYLYHVPASESIKNGRVSLFPLTSHPAFFIFNSFQKGFSVFALRQRPRQGEAGRAFAAAVEVPIPLIIPGKPEFSSACPNCEEEV